MWASLCSRSKVFHFLLCLNAWSLFIITIMSYFRPRRRNLKTRIYLLRWGGRSLFGIGGGGGDVPAITVTFFQTLYVVVKRRITKNPPWSRFLGPVTFSPFQPHRKFDGRYLKPTFHVSSLKLLRYRAPLSSRRDGQAITTSQSIVNWVRHAHWRGR